MSEYVFLFDLDATITKVEILPELAVRIGKYAEMRELTERTMTGELTCRDSFLKRVEMLISIPISEVQDTIERIPLNECLVEFIACNRERCYIVTGNLNVWISRLLKKINMADHCFCSMASVKNGFIESVHSVLDKSLVALSFVKPFVSIGDGSNCKFAIYDEQPLCALLNRLL